MDFNWNTQYINPDNLISIARGEKKRMEKYLRQFQELIPARIDNLQKSLDEKDRKKVRQILHQMSPQLQFFGVPDVLTPIRRLEHEYDSMAFDELEEMINNVILNLNASKKEVDRILSDNF